MLNPIINCVGIAGYIEPGGCPFWVQAFGFNGVPSQPPETIINYDESKGSFGDLYNQILNGNSVRLNKDYEYKNESIFAKGITIDKAVTIDGCGHTIDAKKLARIFNITAGGVILKNINFTNAYLDYTNGGAIHTSGNLTLINCSFSDCFAYYGSAVYSTASSLSLTDCSFNDNFEVKGAVFKQTGNVSVENSNFKNNSAILYGGALCINDAYATISSSIFKNNSAYLRGGAIFSSRSNISITKSSFISNVLDAGGPAYGAVFCAEDSDVLIKDCTFSKNKMNSFFRQAFGGAIYLIDGNVSVIECNFTDNFAMEYGGAVCLVNNNANLTGCNFIGNSVYLGSYASSAGAIYTTGGNITISQTLFSNNAAENGASIALDETEVSIIGCSFLNNPGGSNGAAVFSNNVNLTIDDCNFFNNTCKYNGGAVYLRDGRISVINSVFSKSTAAYGAFLRLENAQISIINDNFTDGVTKNQYYSYGGAMYINNCQGSVEQSEFANNAVYSEEFTTMGGAVRCENSDISFKGCDFSDNLADNGAAISSQNDVISISDSNFKNNTAKNNGGALESDMSNISISNSEFKGDYSFDGGAVYSYGGSLNVRESRFINNSAIYGGAIYSAYSDATVFVSNFTENVADWSGGALYTCNAVNSVFMNNKAINAAAIYGENNNATGCVFIKNIAYADNPTYDVNTIDCTFIDNRLITKATIEIPYLEERYYPGDQLYVYVYAYDYPYQIIDNATLTINVYKNNSLVDTFYFASANNGWTVNVSEGEYFAELRIESDDFEVNPVNVTFNVLKKEIATVDLAFGNYTFSNLVVIDVKSNVDAYAEIYIDDAYLDYIEMAGSESMNLTYTYLQVGLHTFKVVLTPKNSKIDSVTVTEEFEVFKKQTSLKLDIADVTDKEKVIVSVQASEDGDVSVRIGDLTRSIHVNANEKSQIDFGLMKSGEYVVKATFDAGENYIASNDSKTLNVLKKITPEDIKISKDNSKNMAISLPDDATGTVTLTIADQNYDVEIINGTAEVTLPDLGSGEYPYTITYSGDEKYSSFSIEGSLNQDSSDESPKIKPDITIPEFKDGGKVELPGDAKGTVTLTVDGKDYVFDVVNGIADVKLPDIANGAHEYAITYSGDGKYSSFTQSSIMVVERPIVITAANAKVTYAAGLYYTITVKNDAGIASSSVKVDIKLNGKTFKTLSTDSNGKCSFKVSQVPGIYKLTITSGTKSVARTLTVKHLVTLKSVTVKKSAKKLVLTATLGKINKKYLKNKKVTFKFNGKKYTAKTNKKGVAKVTIKSSVLKKLKVGKKVTYQATYSKDTVKKTVKIKK